ncbi:MAG: response regulator transcription factor [Magnetospirillum sp.]|nr:response regulator transcription factor [Magnetospirillum sp.]
MARFVVILASNLYRRGLASALTSLEADSRVVEASNLSEATNALAQSPSADLVLIDPVIAEGLGFAELRRALGTKEAPHVAVVSVSARREDVLSALAAGFYGYIVQSQSELETIGAVRDMLAGRIYVPPFLAEIGPARRLLQSGSGRPAFTGRQIDVLRVLAKGKSNKTIARELSIAESTVKVHVGAVMRLLDVHSRSEVALLAQREIDQLPASRDIAADKAAKT